MSGILKMKLQMSYKGRTRHDQCLLKIKRARFQLFSRRRISHNHYLLEILKTGLQMLFKRHTKHNQCLLKISKAKLQIPLEHSKRNNQYESEIEQAELQMLCEALQNTINLCQNN